jgi:hypothetical protein
MGGNRLEKFVIIKAVLAFFSALQVGSIRALIRAASLLRR